jgi:hypothetical protein
MTCSGGCDLVCVSADSADEDLCTDWNNVFPNVGKVYLLSGDVKPYVSCDSPSSDEYDILFAGFKTKPLAITPWAGVVNNEFRRPHALPLLGHGEGHLISSTPVHHFEEFFLLCDLSGEHRCRCTHSLLNRRSYTIARQKRTHTGNASGDKPHDHLAMHPHENIFIKTVSSM